jgi:hypothetical protein
MRADNKWVVILIAFDDDTDVETMVIKERIPASEDERLAAFLRGGELMAVVMLDDERVAEAERKYVEKMCLR